MIGSIEGNKYINGMIFALGGISAGILTGIAMSYLKETTVFVLCSL